MTFLSQGGGGYGDPYERDPLRVLSDVRRGLVSAEAARVEYGVVIRDGAVYAAATQDIRRSRPPRRTGFDFGPERETFETVWTDALQMALNLSLGSYPLSMRNYLKQRAMAEVDARAQAQRTTEPSGIADLVRALANRMAAGVHADGGDDAPGSARQETAVEEA